MRKQIYLAGGCFWGIEKYVALIPGVIKTTVGYANGTTKNPTYQQVCTGKTDHVEVVQVWYDSAIVSLIDILHQFYQMIDPTSYHKQGNDVGSQYRTGIYFENPQDEAIIQKSLSKLQTMYGQPLNIEMEPIESFYKAEDYHQNYLKKHPNGYCHVDLHLKHSDLKQH